jgi:hypothetical protein
MVSVPSLQAPRLGLGVRRRSLNSWVTAGKAEPFRKGGGKAAEFGIITLHPHLPVSQYPLLPVSFSLLPFSTSPLPLVSPSPRLKCPLNLPLLDAHYSVCYKKPLRARA